MLPELNNKNANIHGIAETASNDADDLSELLEKLKSRNETIRYDSFNALLLISQKNPEVLYPRWKFFEDFLDSDNAFRRLMAVQIIPNIVRVDTENRFEKIFDRYYDLLNDSVIVASHLTANSGRIARAKPHLVSAITNKLMSIDNTTQKHKDLVKSGAIQSFDEYFSEADKKEEILEFVREQLTCESPKTRKEAQKFLKKWEKK